MSVHHVQVHQFIRKMFERARLHAEAVIIALIYIGGFVG